MKEYRQKLTFLMFLDYVHHLYLYLIETIPMYPYILLQDIFLQSLIQAGTGGSKDP